MSTAHALGVAALVLLACERKQDTQAPQFTAQWCEGADPNAIEPPPERWWKHANPCPIDSALSVVEPQGLRLDMPAPRAPMKGELRCVRRDGIPHGPATGFYANGRRQRSGCFVDGELHGRWHHFDEPGALEQSSVFDEGLPTGTWDRHYDSFSERREFEGPNAALVTIYDGRTIREVGRLVDGFREGPWVLSREEMVPRGMSATLERRSVTLKQRYVDGRLANRRSMFDEPRCDAWADAMLRCVRSLPIDAHRVVMGRSLEMITSIAYAQQLLGGETNPATCESLQRKLDDSLATWGCAPETEAR
ncbi:MAG: hypothetical protein IAG13_35590 [Deltaproteobacteria bacterium]|nr:hypothetical protein [Nannocystaceae bacterium]